MGLNRIPTLFLWFVPLGLLLSMGVVQVVVTNWRSCVIGPPPEDIREWCAPVVAWLETEYVRRGGYPRELSVECRTILDKFPYTWEYSPRWTGPGKYDDAPKDVLFGSCGIVIGDGQWPLPLYYLEWTAEHKEWKFVSDYPVSDENVRDILRRKGYYSHTPQEEGTAPCGAYRQEMGTSLISRE